MKKIQQKLIINQWYGLEDINMKLHFNSPTGVKSLKSAQDYINDISTRASDMSSFFKGLEPDIEQSVQSEFDASNPNKWERISVKWKKQKMKEGKPENIGIYSGSLMEASSTGAIKKYYPTGLTWTIAPVDSIDFTRRRKIGITTSEFLRTLGSRLAKIIIRKNTNG